MLYVFLGDLSVLWSILYIDAFCSFQDPMCLKNHRVYEINILFEKGREFTKQVFRLW